jgi:hypothetical protein
MNRIWAGLGIIIAILTVLGGVYGLMRHERASGVREGKAQAEHTQVEVNHEAQAKVEIVTLKGAEHHDTQVVYVDRVAKETVNAIYNAPDLDAALGQWGAGIDQLRPPPTAGQPAR